MGKLLKVSEVAGCHGCPMRQLFPDNTFVAPARGAGLELAIAEAPGQEEARVGEPLVGGAGKVFNAITKKAGIERSDLTIANVIQCRPSNNIFPTDALARSYISPENAQKAVTQCYTTHLQPLLESKPWQRIYAFGDKALTTLTGKTGISKWRGSPLPCPEIDPTKPLVIPTLHPAAIMREQKMIPVAINDLQKSLRIPPENYNLFPSLNDVAAFRDKIFAFDIETSYEAYENGRRNISMVALSADKYHAIVVPFLPWYMPELQRIFLYAEEVIGHNCIQFDIPQLALNGITLNSKVKVWDTMLMQHLRFPELPHDLEFVGSQFSSKPAWKAEKADLKLYAARDVDVTYQCFEALIQEVEHAGLIDLYERVQVPLAKICRKMTETGVKLDSSRLESVRIELLREIEELEQKLPEALRSYNIPKRKRVPAPEGYRDPVTKRPRKFLFEEIQERVSPWRKDRVKKELFYETWGLPPMLHPKTGKISADKIALEKIIRRLKSPTSGFYNPERAETVRVLKEISKKDHMLSSFVKGDNKLAGRVHPEFLVHGTSSGRLSSKGEAGNYQNQPEAARYLYVPTWSDWEIAEVDYSNIENRLTAYLANDRERLHRYDDPNHNDYKLLASRAFGIPYDEVEKDNDREAPYGKAKAIVLGTNYGLGAIKISNMYDMDLKEVRNIMYTWKQEIKQTVEWQRQIGERAKRQGYLVTPFGRKRWFYTDDLYTKALSFLPQSTAADIIYRAMIGLMYERIEWPEWMAKKVVSVVEPLPVPAKLLLQVHDALVFEYPKEMRERVLRTVKRVMEQPWPELNGFSIPVGIAIGPSWGEVKPYKLV